MSRVPPHDLDAERACLGAMLNSRDAIKEALDETSSPSFYAPGHSHVFAAIASLYYRGAGLDPVTVGSELGPVLARLTVPVKDGGERSGREALAYLAAAVPSSYHARSYARTVEELAACRRAMALAEDVGIAAEERDLGKVDELLAGADEAIAPPAGLSTDDRPTELSAITAIPEEPKVWVIPGLLARGERLGLSASEGFGKTTLLRQLTVMVASGIHPFTLDPIPASTALHVDFENEEKDLDEEPRTGYRSLLGLAGPAYTGRGYRRARTQGLDLRSRRDARWLEHQIRETAPAMLVIGPVYKMLRGDRRYGVFSDEAVLETINALDDLRKRYDLALVIEGHSPYGSDGDRAGGRWKGSQLWSAWLSMTRTMVLPTRLDFVKGKGVVNVADGPQDGSVCDLVPWRFDRHDGRPWPKRLVHGESWPWEIPGLTEPTLLDEPPLEEPQGY